MFANAGYAKASFERAIQRAKAGAPAQASAASRATKAAPGAAQTASAGRYRDLDVVGIHLGMAKDEALQKLKEHGPDFNIKEFEGNLGAATGIDGLRYTNGITASKVTIITQPKMVRASDEIEVYFFAPPNKSEVGTIWRRAAFGDPVLFKELQNSLYEKYGKPVWEGKDPKGWYVLSWTYDNRGRPVTKVPHGGIYYDLQQGEAARRNLLFPRADIPSGGFSLVVWLASDGTFVNAMNTAVFDQDLTWDKYQNTRQFIDTKLEERRQQQIQRASGNKPRL